MKGIQIAISYIILIIVGIVVLVLISLFIFKGSILTFNSQINITNTSNNQLNNVLGNLTNVSSYTSS